MRVRSNIGLFAGLLCLAAPLLCRMPRGGARVAQYLPDKGKFILGLFFFGICAVIPALVVYSAAIVSRPPYYLPVVASTLTALFLLSYWHQNNDLAADAQAAISLIFIPIYAAVAAFIAGIIGISIQNFLLPPRENGDSQN